MNNDSLLAARAESQRKKKMLAESQAANMLKTKLKAVQDALKKVKEELESKIMQQNIQQESTDNNILQDLINHIDNKDTKPYSEATINLAMQIKAISPKAYAILASNLPMPTVSQIESAYKNMIGDIPAELTDISRVNDIVDLWKTKHGISKSVNISACLSVDALYFKPDARITVDNCIEGHAFTDELVNKLPDNSYKYFTENPSSFQAFIELNWEKLIKAGFVFQIQPYDINYKPFVVHVRPAANGKATESIIEALHKIREVVKNRKINIKSFAFDGDNAYKRLHVMYYESYIRQVLATNTLKVQATKRVRVVSDYLHLLKRLRYRLLSSILHAGFDKESPTLNIEEIAATLADMGDVVWSNELFTKMHDALPLELFKTENLIELIQNGKYEAAAFWFPITLSNIAINGKDIGFENRDFLLQCAFYFLVYYSDCWNRSEDTLRQKKYGENLDVTFYTRDLLIEFTNTLHAHIQLMHSEKKFNFSRNSSSPLEHKFGFVRGRSHDINTLTRFIQVVASLQTVACESTYNEIRNFNEEAEKIRGRVHAGGITVEEKSDDDLYVTDTGVEDDLPFSPQNVAKTFLILAGFQVEKNDLFDYEEILSWTENFLSSFVGDMPEKRKAKKALSLNTFNFGVDQCSRAKRLIRGMPVKMQSTHRKNKREYKEALFNKMCNERLGGPPSKRNLVEVISLIKEKDPDCPNPPGKRCSKKKMYDWVVDNMNSYFVFLDSYKFE